MNSDVIGPRVTIPATNNSTNKVINNYIIIYFKCTKQGNYQCVALASTPSRPLDTPNPNSNPKRNPLRQSIFQKTSFIKSSKLKKPSWLTSVVTR